MVNTCSHPLEMDEMGGMDTFSCWASCQACHWWLVDGLVGYQSCWESPIWRFCPVKMYGPSLQNAWRCTHTHTKRKKNQIMRCAVLCSAIWAMQYNKFIWKDCHVLLLGVFASNLSLVYRNGLDTGPIRWMRRFKTSIRALIPLRSNFQAFTLWTRKEGMRCL